MNRRCDWGSRLIISAQCLIGLAVLIGLGAFVTLNPYLITFFAFLQVFMIAGVILFVVVLAADRRTFVDRETSQTAARSIYDPEGRSLHPRRRRLRLVETPGPQRETISVENHRHLSK